MALLEVKDLSKRFGGLTALDSLNLNINEGEIRGLIGPNGAGKTTFINVVSGNAPTTKGKVIFNGEDITNHTTDDITKKGLARTFQATSLFTKSTVLENLIVAQGLYRGTGFWGALFHLQSEQLSKTRVKEGAIALSEALGLAAWRDELARNLPHGYQRMLGVAIALATRPKLLLLDEPVTGMNLEETKTMVDIIRRIRDQGITILLVEHSVRTIMAICDKVTVLNFGRRIAEGSPEEIQRNANVLEAYLGAGERAEHAQNFRFSERRTHPDGVLSEASVPSHESRSSETVATHRRKVSLNVKHLRVDYGKVRALKDLSMSVEEGAMVFLIGSNGAGKTTTLRAISGLENPVSGEIWFEGERIDRATPAHIVSMGIIHVPEGRRVFPYLSVWENLKLGAYLRKDKKILNEDVNRVYHYFPVLQERARQKGGSLSGGEQQMLAIARALMGKPKLLLMDEPSIGLAPKVVQDIGRIVTNINKKEEVTVVLVEQNARLALSIADKGYVLETGNVIFEGESKDLSRDQQVKKAYLGE